MGLVDLLHGLLVHTTPLVCANLKSDTPKNSNNYTRRLKVQLKSTCTITKSNLILFNCTIALIQGNVFINMLCFGVHFQGNCKHGAILSLGHTENTTYFFCVFFFPNRETVFLFDFRRK